MRHSSLGTRHRSRNSMGSHSNRIPPSSSAANASKALTPPPIGVPMGPAAASRTKMENRMKIRPRNGLSPPSPKIASPKPWAITSPSACSLICRSPCTPMRPLIHCRAPLPNCPARTSCRVPLIFSRGTWCCRSRRRSSSRWALGTRFGPPTWGNQMIPPHQTARTTG